MNDEYFMIALKGRCLEYIPEWHTYLLDGIIIPSVTQVLGKRFNKKYEGIEKAVLDKAAQRGTDIHNAIEQYCNGVEIDTEEVRNFKFLQKQYGFEVERTELPVLIDIGDKTIAGRLDMALRMDGVQGGADIKTTSALDKEYAAYQLNLYRIGMRQCYGTDWKFLKVIWLRGETRKLVDIPINEEITIDLVKEILR